MKKQFLLFIITMYQFLKEKCYFLTPTVKNKTATASINSTAGTVKKEVMYKHTWLECYSTELVLQGDFDMSEKLITSHQRTEEIAFFNEKYFIGGDNDLRQSSKTRCIII